MEKILSVHKNQRYVVETITMTTVTERRIVRESTEETTIKNVGTAASSTPATADVTPNDRKPPIPAKPENIPAQISGILKGGKLWKNEMQVSRIYPIDFIFWYPIQNFQTKTVTYQCQLYANLIATVQQFPESSTI